MTAAVAQRPADVLRLAIEAARPCGLDDLARMLWRGHGAGGISDSEAEALSALIEARRGKARGSQAITGIAAVVARFTPRRRPISPDRQASRDRRRTLGGGSSLPDKLRRLFTEGERAALTVVAGEVKRTGACCLPLDQIAALSGVGRTTAQNALRTARQLGLVRITHRPRRGAKSLTNIVTIVSAEWMAWLKRGPAAHIGTGFKTSASTKILNPTKSTEKKKANIHSETERGRTAESAFEACGGRLKAPLPLS